MNTLKKLVKDYVIFIDTCSLMSNNLNLFISRLNPLLIENKKQIIIPMKVVDELRKHKINKKIKIAKKAKTSLDLLETLNKKNLIEVRGEKTDNFADNVFVTVFSKHRLNHKLLLITEDKNLAKDILGLNNSKSAKGYEIVVKKLSNIGNLVDFDFMNKKLLKETIVNEIAIEKFELKKELYNFDREKINVKVIPTAGDYVLCDNKKINLVKCIASGGEGSVFETDISYVCKIYKKEKIEKSKFEKIKLMISKGIRYEGICWPISLAYNKYNEFVGYLMPKASGKEIQKCLFIKDLLYKNFPGWNKRDTVQLCLTILDKIEFLNSRNVILGDINPSNILVVNSEKVYFVDTDSYQIEGFPCPVGTINFTAPEIQRKNFNTFLRSFGHENFAVATLLFMIMLPGKPPYSQQGGENPIDNIINMDFSYPLGKNSNKKAPDGPWRYMWSHMPYKVKEAFYYTFRKNEKFSEEKKRISSKDWKDLMEYYLHLLDSKVMYDQDEMSIKLFPTRHKKNPKLVYVKCKICNEEIPKQHSKYDICSKCLKLEEKYNCMVCNKEMTFSYEDKYIKKIKRIEVCELCLKKNEQYKCKRCGKEMFFSNYDKYIKKDKKKEMCDKCVEYLKLHTKIGRCGYCGKIFFETKNEQSNKIKKFGTSRICTNCSEKLKDKVLLKYNKSSNIKKNDENKGNCFITTAICDFLNKEDDCYELTMFRKFRDDWLIKQPEGKRLINEYYEIAPSIVENIEKSSIRDKIYRDIWSEYLIYCLKYIEKNKFEECKATYVLMVKELKEKFNS